MPDKKKLLQDFYAKYAPDQQVTDERIKAIDAKYGDDTSTMLKDLYSKYAPNENLTSERIDAISTKYDLKKKDSQFSQPQIQNPTSSPSGVGKGTPINPTPEQNAQFMQVMAENQKPAEQKQFEEAMRKSDEGKAKSYIAEQMGEGEKETNPLITAGKSAWKTLAYDIPSSFAGAMATMSGSHESFSTPAPTKEQKESAERTKQQLVDWGIKHQNKGAELSKDLVSSLDKVKDPIDALNWVSFALGSTAPQIPLSIASGGTTSIGQEVGSIYLDGVKKIAADKNLTVQQVIEQHLDNPAAAVAFGTTAGMLDYVGAKNVTKVFPKEQLLKSLRSRAMAMTKAGAVEGGTEYSQTWMEQIGAGQTAGNELGKIWDEANTNEKSKERLEAMAQGAVGGSGVHAVSNHGTNENIKTAETSGEANAKVQPKDNLEVPGGKQTEIKNEPGGEGTAQAVQQSVQPLKEEPKQPEGEKAVQPSENKTAPESYTHEDYVRSAPKELGAENPIVDTIKQELPDQTPVEFFLGKKREGVWDAKSGEITEANGHKWHVESVLNEKEGYVKPINKQQNEIGNNPSEVNETGRGRPLSETGGEAEPRTRGERSSGTFRSNREEEIRKDKVQQTEPSPKIEQAEPREIARQYHEESRNPTHINEKEMAISRALLNSKVKMESVRRFGDKNVIGQSIAKSYIRNKGLGLDQIAISANEYLGNDSVEPGDVWEFMRKFPNGAQTPFRPSGNPKLAELANKYSELTGKSINRKTAKSVMNKFDKTSIESEEQLKEFENSLSGYHNPDTGKFNYKNAISHFEQAPDLIKSAYGLTEQEFQNLKRKLYAEQEKDNSPATLTSREKGSNENIRNDIGNASGPRQQPVQSQEQLARGIESKIGSLRSAETEEERQRLAQEIYDDTGNYLLNREGVIVGDDASFADRTSDTFFDLIDSGKSVYLLDPDSKIAESVKDYQHIQDYVNFVKGTETPLPLQNGKLMFDDAFEHDVINAARELGFDGVRLLEIDGTNSTIQIINFNKLTHVSGDDFIKIKSEEHAIQKSSPRTLGAHSGGNEIPRRASKSSGVGPSEQRTQTTKEGERKQTEEQKPSLGDNQSEEVGKQEANKIAEEKGFNSATHLLNSVKKRSGKVYEKVQDVPHEEVSKAVHQRTKESLTNEGSEVSFEWLGDTKHGKVLSQSEDKVKIKSGKTIFTVGKQSVSPYEGEQASTQKHYEPPVGAPRKKAKGQRVNVSPIYGAEPKSLKQVMIDLSKSIPSKIFYTKRPIQGRRALGSYNPRNAAIAIKFNNDLDTTAHELGHSMDDVFDLLGKANTNAKSELNHLSQFGSKPPKGHPKATEYKLGEGMAEFIRAYLVNPDEARKQFPETTQLFESTVPKETIEKIRDFGDDIRKFAGLSGHHQIMSNVEFKPSRAEGTWKKLVKNRTPENFELTPFDRFQKNFTNSMFPFEKSVKWLMNEKGIEHLAPSKDPIILARLFNGITDKIGDIIKNGFVQDVTNKNGKVRVNRMKDPVTGETMNFQWLIEPLDNTSQQSILDEQQEVISYMVAKRTLELEKKLQREDILTGIGAGVFKDVDTARKRIEEHNAMPKEKKERIEEAARRYREYAKTVLHYAVDNGRLSQAAFDDIVSTNLEYVALQRLSEISPEEEIVPFKNSKGGGAVATAKDIVKKVKGSSKTIKNPYTSLIENTISTVKEADRNNVMLAFKDLFTEDRNMREGEPLDKLAQVARPAAAGDKNTVAIFDKGEKQYWQLDDDVYQAVKNINDASVQLPGVITALPRMLRWSVTNFPTFAIRNRIRDIQHRLVVSSTNNLGTELNKENRQASHEAFATSGGGQAGLYLHDKNYYDYILRQATKELAKDPKVILSTPEKIKQNFSDWGKSYHKLISSGESATRLEEYRSAYKQAKAKGLDDYNASLYAAFQARDLMDFAVSGNWIRVVNQLIPFTNAAIQGLSKTIRSAKQNPRQFMTRWALYSLVPALINRALVHMLDRDDEYEELPAWRRDLFYNIPIGSDLWLALPKSFEIGVFSSGGDRLMSAMMGYEKTFSGYWGSIYKTLLPIGFDDLVGPMKGISGILTNYDYFRNKNIIPPHEQKLDLEYRNTERASRLGKAIKQIIQVDPRFIDYAIKNQLGYFGDFALRASDIGRENTSNKFDVTMTGLLRRSPVYDSKSLQKFFELVDKYGVSRQSSAVKEINHYLANYFDETDPKQKELAGEEVINKANEWIKIYESEDFKKHLEEKHEAKVAAH